MGINRDNKVAFMTCVEVVLMRMSNINYNDVVCKLEVLYQCTILDCYDYPERLKVVLKKVYKNNYETVLEEIETEMEVLVDVDLQRENFLRFMRS